MGLLYFPIEFSNHFARNMKEMIKKSFALIFAATLIPASFTFGQSSFSDNYGGGIHQYFDAHYEEAIHLFNFAIDENDNDARAFYFRGLSQLGLDNFEAADSDFRRGASIETGSDKRRSGLVTESLERIQGPIRILLEKYRGNTLPANASLAELLTGVDLFYRPAPIPLNVVFGPGYVFPPTIPAFGCLSTPVYSAAPGSYSTPNTENDPADTDAVSPVDSNSTQSEAESLKTDSPSTGNTSTTPIAKVD
jgi:hypothetical protein